MNSTNINTKKYDNLIEIVPIGEELNNSEGGRGILENSIEIRGIKVNGVIRMMISTAFVIVVDHSQDRPRGKRRIRRAAAHRKQAQKQTQMKIHPRHGNGSGSREIGGGMTRVLCVIGEK